MEELIATIARGLVDDKEAVSVTADPADEEGNVVYHLAAARRSRLTEQNCGGGQDVPPLLFFTRKRRAR